MGAAKEHFLKDKESVDKLNACAHSDWFRHALILAKAEIADEGATADEMRGAKKLESVLLSLGDPDPLPAEYPNSGLEHDLDVKPRELQTKK